MAGELGTVGELAALIAAQAVDAQRVLDAEPGLRLRRLAVELGAEVREHSTRGTVVRVLDATYALLHGHGERRALSLTIEVAQIPTTKEA